MCIVGQHVVTADHVDHHADLRAAVNVARDPALGLDPREAPDRHVLADAADHGAAHLVYGRTVQRQGRQRRHIHRIVRGHQRGQIARERQKVLVLGDEIGLAVDLDDGTEPGVGGDVRRDHAFRGDAAPGFACLVSQAHAQNLLGLAGIAVGLGQRLLAFHHRRVGFLAQLFHHRRGDFRHKLTPRATRAWHSRAEAHVVSR
jgi:hypothetical protein